MNIEGSLVISLCCKAYAGKCERGPQIQEYETLVDKLASSQSGTKSMKSNRAHPSQQKSPFRAFEEHFWNLIGGSLVVAMLAGVIYLLVGMIASEFYGNDSYWELTFFYKLFVGLLVFYLVLPKLFTAVLSFLVGASAGTKKRDY